MTKTLLIASAACLLAVSAASAQTRLPAQMNIENRRAATLTALSIYDAQGNAIATLARPVAGGKKGAIKLGRAQGCEMNVQARFDDEAEVDETVNLCREKVLRFRE